MAVIDVKDLTKRYGGRVVVDGISFAVEQGEIFGILGPNGAGKTTVVRDGLRGILEGSPEFEVVAEAGGMELKPKGHRACLRRSAHPGITSSAASHCPGCGFLASARCSKKPGEL
jgi:ABC-type hemin transport system ATPase subunit